MRGVRGQWEEQEVLGTHSPGEYGWGREEKNNCRVPEKHTSLIWQGIYALHKCHVSVLGLGLGQRCFWAPVWAEIPQAQLWRAWGVEGIGESMVGGTWIRVLWKCSRTLLLKPHRNPPNLAHQVGCLYVWVSNLIFTQPWDCFLKTTTAATWFCFFGVVFFCLGLISPLYRNTRFLGELRYISAFWKYFLEAYARAIDQILRDPCWHSILNCTFLILIVMKYCQAEVLVLYQTVFPSESMPDANKSKQFSPLPFFL